MPITSSSSAQSLGGVVWAQLQQQQAQRAADQAEQNARSLKLKAREAEATAVRAQDEARGVKIEYNKAEIKAGSARQNLLQLDSVSELQQGFQAVREQIASSTVEGANSSSAAASSGVTNAYGQQTGTLVDVTA